MFYGVTLNPEEDRGDILIITDRTFLIIKLIIT